MDLSLSEAARLLGKTDRQVRYLVQVGRIPASKKDGRWIIRRDDLPLSQGQLAAAQQKAERAGRLAAEILRPDAEAGEEARADADGSRPISAQQPLERSPLQGAFPV